MIFIFKIKPQQAIVGNLIHRHVSKIGNIENQPTIQTYKNIYQNTPAIKQTSYLNNPNRIAEPLALQYFPYYKPLTVQPLVYYPAYQPYYNYMYDPYTYQNRVLWNYSNLNKLPVTAVTTNKDMPDQVESSFSSELISYILI